MISDKGGWGVSAFLIFSDKGGRGGKPFSDFWLTRGGGGVWTPPFLADIICEQPLIAPTPKEKKKKIGQSLMT